MEQNRFKPDWLTAGLFSDVKLQMVSNRELLIEGCKGILEYDETVIRINLGHTQLQIVGRGLSIPVMERNLVQIQGYITSLAFM